MSVARAKKKRDQAAREPHSSESRLNFRLGGEIKLRVARAAALSGQDLTEFAVATLSEKADQVIERYNSLLINSEDYSFFLQVLDEENFGSEPSARSQAAAEKYRQGSRKGVRHQFDN